MRKVKLVVLKFHELENRSMFFNSFFGIVGLSGFGRKNNIDFFLKILHQVKGCRQRPWSKIWIVYFSRKVSFNIQRNGNLRLNIIRKILRKKLLKKRNEYIYLAFNEKLLHWIAKTYQHGWRNCISRAQRNVLGFHNLTFEQLALCFLTQSI